mmetsp:Transcript_73121/g.237829  ORF Transcript_73121/g.237829 Transcript_73121/m.237829 type:complete len:200 (-) Transcript_73121:2850-3449(-)
MPCPRGLPGDGDGGYAAPSMRPGGRSAGCRPRVRAAMEALLVRRLCASSWRCICGGCGITTRSPLATASSMRSGIFESIATPTCCSAKPRHSLMAPRRCRRRCAQWQHGKRRCVVPPPTWSRPSPPGAAPWPRRPAVVGAAPRGGWAGASGPWLRLRRGVPAGCRRLRPSAPKQETICMASHSTTAPCGGSQRCWSWRR